MAKEKRYFRETSKVDEDELIPETPFGEEKRQAAVIEVLCRLPEDAYQKLREEIAVNWFIPPAWMYGVVTRFAATHQTGFECLVARVIYLSPTLEKLSQDIVVALAAHELAHALLGHSEFSGMTKEEFEAREEETWKQAEKWGFEEEVKKSRSLEKRQETIARRKNRENTV